jgi:hypothetical protein
MPNQQQVAIEQLFSTMGGSLTSVSLIRNLNLLFLEFKDNGEEITKFSNLISALKQLHAVQHTDKCSRLFSNVH